MGARDSEIESAIVSSETCDRSTITGHQPSVVPEEISKGVWLTPQSIELVDELFSKDTEPVTSVTSFNWPTRTA